MMLLTLVAGLAGWYLYERSKRRTRAMPAGRQADRVVPHVEEWELYHNDFSLCSKKTRVCLAELGVRYRSHHIDLIETGSYETLSRDYLAVHPGAILPLLVHAGHPIFESHEQIRYAATHAGTGRVLMPEDPERLALAEHWVHRSSLIGDDPIAAMRETAGNAVPGLTAPLFATMIAFIPARKILVGLLFHRLRVRPLMFLAMKLLGASRVARVSRFAILIRKSREAMADHLDDLEAVLGASGGPWICGDQFTLADVGMMVILDRLREGDWIDDFLADKRPNVASYWEALQRRDSYESGIARHNHPLVARGTEAIVTLKRRDPVFADVLQGAG